MNHSGPPDGKQQTQPPRSEQPRRIRHGIKLRAREHVQADNWVAQRWLRLLDRTFDPDIRAEGITYAKAGQTATLNIETGVVDARVQGRAPRAYSLELRFEPMTAQQWEAVLAEMAGGAIYVARLLSGEMPPNLGELFASHGIELVPTDPSEMAVSCTCDEPNPCKHAAAVAYLLAERLNSQPLLVFTMYGMPAEQLVEQLRQARAIHTHGVASAHSDPLIPESQIEPQPLETCLDEFWRNGSQLAELEKAPPPQHVAHALLRRLGPSPMKGRFPLVGLLASIYDTVSQEAIKIRDRAEHIEPPDDDQ